jgi:hypothetical protein
METQLNLFELAVDLEHKRCQALMSNDAEKLAILLSEDLYYGHSSGYGDNKKDFIRGIEDRVYVYKSVSTTLHNVNPVGEQGIVINGEIQLVVELAGKETSMNSVYVAVWRKEGSEWLFLTHQTAIKKVQ